MSSANRLTVKSDKATQIGPFNRMREVQVTLRNNVVVLAAISSSEPGGIPGITLSVDVPQMFRLEPADALFLTNTNAGGIIANVEVLEQPPSGDGVTDLLKTLIEKC